MEAESRPTRACAAPELSLCEVLEKYKGTECYLLSRIYVFPVKGSGRNRLPSVVTNSDGTECELRPPASQLHVDVAESLRRLDWS